eukprot:366417-Chlamydomonas_euryale.AAC.13
MSWHTLLHDYSVSFPLSVSLPSSCRRMRTCTCPCAHAHTRVHTAQLLADRAAQLRSACVGCVARLARAQRRDSGLHDGRRRVEIGLAYAEADDLARGPQTQVAGPAGGGYGRDPAVRRWWASARRSGRNVFQFAVTGRMHAVAAAGGARAADMAAAAAAAALAASALGPPCRCAQAANTCNAA